MGRKYTGVLPKHWKENKVGGIYKERITKVSDKDFPPLSVTKKGVVPQLDTVAKTNDNDNRKLVKKNDFVINSRSDRRGSCGISDYDGSVSLINTVLEPINSDKFFNNYYDWLFHTENFADEFYKWGHGIVDDLWTTRWLDMKNIEIPYPPLEEQKKIADFLDDKCAQIDEITKDLEVKINSLLFYKQKLITEVAVEGSICKNKAFTKLKYIASSFSKSLSLSSLDEEYEYPVIGASGLLNVKSHFYECNNPYIGIVKDGAGIGNCYICEAKTSVLGTMAYILPKDDINIRFLYYVLVGLNLSQQTGDNTTIPHIYFSNYGNNKVLKISSEEQKKIADFLDDKCAQIDEITKATREEIETLKQYKQSLIYEYVTGKKEAPNE